ncbi:hypothetical protein OSTOST_20968 [Ostertagia ostertagi]
MQRKRRTLNPHYQTLAGVGGDVFGADKKAAGGGGGGGGGKPKAPANQYLIIFRAAKAATFDPNYQTLAGIGGDVFGADKKGGGGGKPAAPKAPANLGAKGRHVRPELSNSGRYWRQRGVWCRQEAMILLNFHLFRAKY